jgi:phenylacetate-CoA ligase
LVHTAVHEDYGSAELGSIGAECGEQSGIHIFDDLFNVEVIKNGRPAQPGEIWRVLITDYYNYSMPLIRYDIGDVGLFVETPCPYGRPSRRIEIKGRLKTVC